MEYIKGLDEVDRKLKLLSDPRAAKRAATRAARKSMAIVRDKARANAKALDDPETAEKIWKNIAIRSGKARNKSDVLMRVGVRGGASFSNKNPPNMSGGDTRHWRFIEFGSVHNPPIPFMRLALSSSIQQITDSFAATFSAELDKELMKR